MRKEAVGRFALSLLAVRGDAEWNDPIYVMLGDEVMGKTTDLPMEFVPSDGQVKLTVHVESHGISIRYSYSVINRDFTIEILDKEGNVTDTFNSRVHFEGQSTPSE